MSLIPLEDPDEPQEVATTDGPVSLQERVRALLAGVGSRVGSLAAVFLPDRDGIPDDGRQGPGTSGSVSDSDPESGSDSDPESREASAPLPARVDGGNHASVESSLVAGRLRIRDTDDPDAYVSSDVYERVEQ